MARIAVSVAVVIPGFSLEACPWRMRAFGLVLGHLLVLGWQVTTGEGASAAAARNHGRVLADGGPFDVLVFNDADTLVPHTQIREAARLAVEAPGLVFAFEEYARLGKDTTEKLATAADAFEAPVFSTFTEPPSHGCVAISRACFLEVGGYDERLETFEDLAFTAACEQRWPSRRVAGRAVHLWHPRLGDAGDKAWEERYASSRLLYETGATHV